MNTIQLVKLSLTMVLKTEGDMLEERLPYKKEVGGSIPPCPNDIIISVKNK